MATRSEYPKLQIAITADASGVRDGVNDAKQEINKLNQDLQRQASVTKETFKTAAEAAKASGLTVRQYRQELRAIEAEADKAAKAEERFTRQIRLKTAALQGEAALIRERGQQRGISAAIIEREVAAYEKQAAAVAASNAALRAGGRQLDAYGNTAKQTAAALRQVPAQLTDIVVSLQGGQAPLTVLLQQGGQLRDIFGGVTPALKAFGATLLGLINPFTVVAGAAGAFFLAYQKGSAELQEFNKTLILTGNTLGLTGTQLQDIARSVDQASSSITQSRAAEVLNQIAATGKIGADNMARFTQAAIEFEKAGGAAADETVKAFAELGKAPLEASLKLTESTNYLTVEIYDQIKALEQQGRFTDAARVAQEAYAASIESRTPQLVQNLGYVERAWQGIKDVAAAALSQILEIGRSNPLRELEQQLQLAYATSPDPANDPAIRSLEARYVALKRVVDAEKERAKAAGDAQTRERAQLALTEQAAKAEGGLADQRRKVAEATDLFRKATAGLAKDSDEYRRAEAEYLAVVSKITAAETERTRAVRGRSAAEREAEEQRKRDLQVVELRNKLVQEGYEAEQKAIAASTKAYFDQIAALEKSASSIEDQVQKLKDEEAAATLAAAKNISLAVAIQEVAVARLQEQQASLMRQGNMDAEVLAIQREIDARRELIKQITSKEDRDAAKKQAEDVAKEWKRTAEKIEDALTDALMRGFESGKDFARVLRDTVVNMFKTMVLRPVIQAVVNPVAGAITGALGLAGTANAAGTGLNVISAVGTLTSMGSYFATGFMNTIAGTGTMAGLSAGSAIGGASGFATSLGAVAPWVLGGAALLKLLGGNGNTLSGTGGFYSTMGLPGTVESARLITGGDRNAAGDLIERAKPEVLQFVTTTVDAILAAASDKAEMLGRDIALGINAGFAIDPEDKASYGYAAIFANDQQVGSYYNRELGGDFEKAAQQFTADLIEQVAKAVLGDQTLVRAGETSAQALDRLATSLQVTNAAFDTLGTTLFDASLQGGSFASQLIDLFGGVDQFNQATTSYFQNFYSEAERTETATRQLSEALGQLGISLPESRDAYRQLVESQDLTTESGRATYAALIQLSGAFATLNPEVQDTVTAVEGISETLRRLQEEGRDLERELLVAQGGDVRAFDIAGFSEAEIAAYDYNQALRDQIQTLLDAAEASQAAAEAETARIQAVASERAGLERQLLQLQGDTAALRQLERDALDESNRALYDQITALQDQIAANEEAATAARALAETEKAIANERAGLEQRLLQLQGDTTALRELERNALDESNRALFDQIIALEDQQAAAQEAAKAAEALAQAEERILNERLGLEKQLLQLQGDTAALRKLERDALDETNQGLYDQIVALEDQQTAARAAAEVQRELEQQRSAVINERAGLERQLLQLQGDTTALRQLERDALDESNRALYDQIIALEDQQAAARATADAERELEQQRLAVANERAGLERQLLELQGNTAALRELERNSLDESNRALYDQIVALEDQQVAARAAADAERELEQQRQAVANERAGLERQLLQLQGDTTALRELERSALDESNRALYDMIVALEDQQEAARQTAEAERELEQQRQAIANERAGLERQLLQLQGDTAALRQLERNALDESNRALYDQIVALEDQQEAARLAADAERELLQQREAVANERLGLERRLLEVQGDTNALRALDLAALDESNRALQEQIWAIEDAKQAQEEYARAIASVTASVEQEIGRLRDSISGNRQQSVASLQAQFALLTAQARSGDLTAAGQLAEISQAVENAASLTATSALDVDRIRAYLSSSLEETLRLLGGTGVSSNVITDPTTGAQTTIISSTPTGLVANSSDQAILAELQALRTDNQAQASSIVNLQYKLTKIVERWDIDGLPEERVTA